MSLACTECENVLGPSKSLPGREGVIIHPIVPSFLFLPTEKGISYEIGYLYSDMRSNLCFECIEKKIPKERKDLLSKVYESHEIETYFRMINYSQQGRWNNSKDGEEGLKAYNEHQESLKKLEKNCLFSGNSPDNGNPFFVGKIIEKAYSSRYLSGLPMLGEMNYSWSNYKEGSTYINFCFEDFQTNFPKSFRDLSYGLLKKKDPDLKAKPNEVYISPRFESALEKEGGKSVDKFIEELNEKSGNNIVRIKKRILRKVE
jgi:hypothetical protein